MKLFIVLGGVCVIAGMLIAIFFSGIVGSNGHAAHAAPAASCPTNAFDAQHITVSVQSLTFDEVSIQITDNFPNSTLSSINGIIESTSDSGVTFNVTTNGHTWGNSYKVHSVQDTNYTVLMSIYFTYPGPVGTCLYAYRTQVTVPSPF